MKIYQFQLLFYIMWEGRYRTRSLIMIRLEADSDLYSRIQSMEVNLDNF